MPAYNAEHYIVEALQSILSQAYTRLEIIVVDDGSTDATFERASTLDSCITVLQQSHQGISPALNHGIRAARGEWLSFHDADDIWTPGSLANRFAALRSGNPPDCVFGHVQNFYSPETDTEFRERVICPAEPLAGIGYYTLLIQREVFLRVGLFDESWRLGTFMEWLERANALELNQSVVPQVVLRRRLHPNNTGLRELAARQDYARVLKAILARKRAAQQP